MPRSFDWMARPYVWLERALMGRSLERARLALLPSLDQATRVLILGEGDGRFVSALVRRNPNASIVVVERSRAMIEQAQHRLQRRAPSQPLTVKHKGHVSFVPHDVQDWLQTPGAGRFDAVVTLFFLDCFEAAEQRMLVRAITERTCASAVWLWADFVQPTAGLIRFVARPLIAGLYWVFRLTTDIRAQRLHEARIQFEAQGWTCQLCRRFAGGMLEAKLFSRALATPSQ